ncbi:slowpoke-binding -like [Brachionus plicatilis]|uniref:Slowpoke-binding-like n=1 Tax=Brachionus plicatilis TaxID=10195 RepID=A0A3M7Q787_BRAPC|nr:slowpoke-binding -like [Brachionus plicatilis]
MKKLADIADSMSMSLREMEIFLEKFFKSIKHPNFLPFETLDLNFEKNRILFIQDYSRDGSLRDHLHKNNPNDIWEIKSSQKSTNSIALKNIKEYSNQILNVLIYLKQNFLMPFDNLHSGNVILAYKKKICLLTGYENSFFFAKTRSDKINEESFDKLRKKYLIQVTDSDGTSMRKAKSDIEIKRLIETIRFGLLIVEMCIGNEQPDLLPSEDLISSLKTFYNDRDFDQIKNCLYFLFFNRTGLGHDEKFKNKFLLPTLEQIAEHEFFSISKFKTPNLSGSALEPEQIEFLNYMTGKLEIKIKKLRRKSSLAMNQFSNKKQLSSINEASFEITEEKNENKSIQSSTNIPNSVLEQNITSVPVPTPPPPPPPISSNTILSSGPPPPAPPPPPALNILHNPPSQPSDDSDRSALLGDIRKGMKLKKAFTTFKLFTFLDRILQ